ncbi:MAG TPA: hypothetical protein DEF41_04400 [Desulfovibrio sp.]|uniref:Uncharacterized protein n=1 Tax=Nitratidesulfovibrio vulgaris (strain ATCC 29579 / DSM 644 / CCUG 34227 / NCIMB 8303 / VKM B-1760 / Hildenborough) TaxID=882 RepID=Q72B65_NITV2|nr:hypothetical protein DVU_1773 [Nitratidesulfovibrio vulgaris str. Hildenborough]HBW15377.1 hypothetical protein [Desulfovibrio sp.]
MPCSFRKTPRGYEYGYGKRRDRYVAKPRNRLLPMSREERKPENLPWKPFAYSTSDMWLCYAALKRIVTRHRHAGTPLIWRMARGTNACASVKKCFDV